MIQIIIAIIVIWLALTYLPIPAPMRTLIGVIAGLIIVIWLLKYLGIS